MMNQEQIIALARQLEEQSGGSVTTYVQAVVEQRQQLGESDYLALLGYLSRLINGDHLDDQPELTTVTYEASTPKGV